MSYYETEGRHKLLQMSGKPFYSLYPVVNEEYLSSPVYLTGNYVGKQGVGAFKHVSFDRQPVLRRRLNNAYVPHARESHVQCTRNRRCGQGKHVHVVFEVFYAFLRLDAETLFLVENEKSQILEFDVLAQKPVSAANKLRLAAFRFFQNFFLLLRGTEPVETRGFHAKLFHPFGGGFKMLLGKNSRRRKKRHLLACRNDLESGAQSDFRLSVAHVAADETVHDFFAGKVVVYLFYAFKLVFRFSVRKGFCKSLFQKAVGRIGKTSGMLPCGVKLQQIESHLFEVGFYFCLYLFEVVAPELAELRRFFASRVFCQKV